ncbi:peptidase C39 family protein [Agromyces bauzanensis]
MTETSASVGTRRPAGLDDDLLAELGDASERWLRSRHPYQPTVRTARRGGRPVAALLTTRRPNTLAVKIAAYWATDDAAGSGLVDELIRESAASGDAVVKWEVATDEPVPPFAARLGFAELTAPYVSAAGTTGLRGFARWLRATPPVEPPYYAQTTEFTCGAVAALLATEAAGEAGFGGGGVAGRDREITFWRGASNYPACEPIGLAVALQRETDPGTVEVHLDHDGPVLLESFGDGFDHAFRAELQTESLRQARTLGLPVGRERIAVSEIERRIVGGALALLLIDEGPMHDGQAVPHWVLAHHAADGVVVIQDPWITADEGESWIDTHLLPIRSEIVDRMTAWGPARYRGVIFLERTAG